jgi:ATP-dependent DNA helicase RecG
MPESHNIEYKVNWRDEYLKWICGFVNASGGKLYIHISIDDDGKVTGIDNREPARGKGQAYLEIIVPRYDVPISVRGKYYVRTGSTLQELKGPALNEFIRLYDHNFSVWNDGGLPEGISEEDLKKVHRSKPRNPLIADTCFKAGLY